MQIVEGFLDHFGSLEDPREPMKVLHPLPELLLVMLCAVIAGAEGWEDIETYGTSKLSLLREFLPFTHGVASDDTFRRFFRAIEPKVFQEVFVSFVRSVYPGLSTSLIALDGKTLRGSQDGAT